MKKFLAVLIACTLILTGCASDESEYKIGVIRHLNTNKAALEKFYAQIDDDDSHGKNVRHVVFNSMTEMTAALKAHQVDEIITYEIVARYLSAHNWDFDWTPAKAGHADAFCCAFREQDVALKKEFNDALDTLITDGTLKELVKIYLIDVGRTDVIPIVEMPTFYNDEFDDDFEPPIRIGVTGDLPPLDFVTANGTPAGFNTALLAEISKRLKKNFVLVSIDSGARGVALTSKLVDVVFWIRVPTYDDIPINMDKPDGMILTDPYFTDEIVHVRLKQ